MESSRLGLAETGEPASPCPCLVGGLPYAGWHNHMSSRSQAAVKILDVESDWDPQAERSLSSEDFVALLLRHETRVRSFILTLTLAPVELDDVFQNTCIVAFRKFETFRYTEDKPDEAFVRWVCTIARYEVLRLLRSRKLSKVAFDSELVETLADMQLKEMEILRDRAELLAECIKQLNERDRGMLTLRYGESLDVVNIAPRVGLSERGCYAALERIRDRLLACIQRKLRKEG